MGCLSSTENSAEYDIVGSLSEEDRWEYLAFGFTKRNETNCNCRIPIETKLIITKYISHDRIWSMKELDWKAFGQDTEVKTRILNYSIDYFNIQYCTIYSIRWWF